MFARRARNWALGGAFTIVAIASAVAQQPVVLPDLDQGWDTGQRQEWYDRSQGSRLIPLTWFQYLETKEGGEFFGSFENLSRFGYLPRPGAGAADLPIGFAEDVQSDLTFGRTKLRWKARQGDKEPWLGFNCSACHTGAIEYEGKSFLVDGGQSMSNFQAFMKSLNAALEDTRGDPVKWKRLAGNVLPQGESDDALKTAFDALLSWQHKEAEQNDSPLEYGPGRIDAFGHIFNKVALTLDYDNATKNPADAPVSIPFIWRAPQLESLQYNGIAKKMVLGNIDFGALGRNVGEVIGVFGDVVAHKDPGVLDGFTSSVEVRNLIGLEDTLAELRPPAWPKSLPKDLTPGVTSEGETLFKEHCESCHEIVDRKELSALIDNKRLFRFAGDSPGTDPWMACNAIAYRSSSGVLNGLQSDAITDDVKLGPEAGLATLLQATVKATLFSRKADIAVSAIRKFFHIPVFGGREGSGTTVLLPPDDPRRSATKSAQLDKCKTADMFGYTARPLNGVWATAPYLHNGSVPDLNSLLLPPDERPRDFWVGTRQYNPKLMGFDMTKEAPGNTFHFVARDDKGPIDGNSNAGHDYGNADLTDPQRHAIIEYLKTL